MTVGSRFACRLLAATAFVLSAAPALASMGQPSPWQINLQDAATPIMEQIHSFNTFINIIIGVVTLLVLVLLGICVLRFNEKRNPVPSKTTHHTMLEVVWSVVPVLVLVMIAIPSFRLLYAQYDFPKADLTIKVTGLQWFWKIEYQTAEAPADPAAAAATNAQAAAPQPDFEFDARLLPKDQVGDEPYLLAVDNVAVVPVGKVVRVQVTGGDVIHAFAVPSFGVKIDAVPGRLNETWFRADREGMYYGQCSELCGKDHAFMPIAFRVVSEPEYQAWLVKAREQFAMNPVPRAVADASAAMSR